MIYKKSKIRLIVLFVLFALSSFVFSACSISEWMESELQDEVPGDTPGNDEPKDYSVTFTLTRYTGESLDPYLSDSRTNRDLLSLCYDGLIFNNSSYEPVPVIAESYESDLKRVVFTLNSNACFSDGTPVTAIDCQYSYSLAMKKNSVYYDRFDYISDFEVLDDGRFAVYFKTESVYNVNLCDIPIVKRGSDGDFAPIGSGKYRIVRENASVYLEKNPYSMVDNGENFEISKILVHNILSTEELLYNFNYNKIHGSYTDITDKGSEFRGNIETVSFCDNSLVFVTVNKTDPESFLANPSFSKGLTYCFNRMKICAEILSGGTQPVWYPFNPDWSVTVKAELNSDIYSTVSAHDYFTEAGVILSETVRVYEDEPVELKIIVNSENLTKVEVAEFLAHDLEEMGFKVNLVTLTWDKYLQAIEDYEYDIYVGEVMMPQNMDVSALLSDNVNSGDKYVEWELNEAIALFNKGELSMRDFLSAYQEELPIIPLYFNRGALAVNRVVSGNFAPYNGNLYNGIENWSFSK